MNATGSKLMMARLSVFAFWASLKTSETCTRRPLQYTIESMNNTFSGLSATPDKRQNSSSSFWSSHCTTDSPVQNILIIQSNVELGPKMIQFNIQFKMNSEIFIQSKNSFKS